MSKNKFLLWHHSSKTKFYTSSLNTKIRPNVTTSSFSSGKNLMTSYKRVKENLCLWRIVFRNNCRKTCNISRRNTRLDYSPITFLFHSQRIWYQLFLKTRPAWTDLLHWAKTVDKAINQSWQSKTLTLRGINEDSKLDWRKSTTLQCSCPRLTLLLRKMTPKTLFHKTRQIIRIMPGKNDYRGTYFYKK